MGIVSEKAALRKTVKKLLKENATKTRIISDLTDEIKRIRGDLEFLKDKLGE